MRPEQVSRSRSGDYAHSGDYGGDRPALVIGDESPESSLQGYADCGVALTREILADAGVRLAPPCALAHAAKRIESQAAAALIWLESGRDPPDEALLAVLGRIADSGTPVIVALPTSLIDSFAAALPQSGVQLLVDPGPADRAAAIAVALARRAAPARLSDVGRDNAVRLRQLSDEVGRIASSLARLSAVPGEPSPPALVTRDFGKVPEVDGEHVRSVIRARRLRGRFFDENLFADPAWDMLLDLLQAEIAQHRVPVSSLCIAAAVPATTALRWLKSMTDAGLFVRRADPHDGRRIFVELSPEASAAMRRYFAEAGDVAGL